MGARFSFLAAIPIIVLWALAANAGTVDFKDPDIDYSADQYMASAGMNVHSKVYHSHNKVRNEMSGTVSISRMDKKVVWILMPTSRSYQEFSMEEDGPGGGRMADPSTADIKITPMGRETVNGLETTKNNMVMTAPDGSKSTGTMWVTDEGIMVKMVFIGNSMDGIERPVTIELKNVQIGRQDSDLFEIPAGYVKMQPFVMPGQSMMPPGGPGSPYSPPSPDGGAINMDELQKSLDALREMGNQGR